TNGDLCRCEAVNETRPRRKNDLSFCFFIEVNKVPSATVFIDSHVVLIPAAAELQDIDVSFIVRVWPMDGNRYRLRHPVSFKAADTELIEVFGRLKAG